MMRVKKRKKSITMNLIRLMVYDLVYDLWLMIWFMTCGL